MKPGLTYQKLVSLNKISPVTEKTHLIQKAQWLGIAHVVITTSGRKMVRESDTIIIEAISKFHAELNKKCQ